MFCFKKVTALIVSALLCVSLMGAPAYAQGSTPLPAQGSDLPGIAVQDLYDQAIPGMPQGDEVVTASQEDASTDTTLKEAFPAATALMSSQELEALIGSPLDFVDAASAIEFVYLEESLIALGQQENIAIALKDETPIGSAYLIVAPIGSGDAEAFDVSAIAQNAMLFTLSFTERAQAKAYRVLGVAYSQEGQDSVAYADFTADTSIENSYLFEVVTPETLEAMTQQEAQPGEVNAFIIDDEGALQAADSL
ncbi:MAG: hypothetical protein LBG81_03730, partial [Coriobacteriaceae bacterium]|nr:hypothetical protein [Coriobacteriaceae bacterium]